MGRGMEPSKQKGHGASQGSDPAVSSPRVGDSRGLLVKIHQLHTSAC